MDNVHDETVRISARDAGGLRNSGDHEISFKELFMKINGWWRYFLSKWVLIMISVILGAGLGFAYAFSKKAVYRAETTFVLEEENRGGGMLGQLGGIAGLAGIDVAGGGGGLFQGDNIIQLYKSRSMVEKALLSEVEYKGKRDLLINRYIKINNLRDTWSENRELLNLRFSLHQDEKLQRLQDSILNLTVKVINTRYLTINKPDKKLNIIKVEVISEDEFFAKAFNDQLVKNVNDFYIQTKTKKSLENLAILQHQTDSVRNVLNGAIYQTASVADATPNLNPTRQILRAPAQRSQFNAEANKAILTQLVQNLELAKLSLRKEKPLIQLVDTPVYPLEKKQFGKYKGIILGGIILGFVTILLLTIKRLYLQIINEE